MTPDFLRERIDARLMDTPVAELEMHGLDRKYVGTVERNFGAACLRDILWMRKDEMEASFGMGMKSVGCLIRAVLSVRREIEMDEKVMFLTQSGGAR